MLGFGVFFDLDSYFDFLELCRKSYFIFLGYIFVFRIFYLIRIFKNICFMYNFLSVFKMYRCVIFEKLLVKRFFIGRRYRFFLLGRAYFFVFLGIASLIGFEFYFVSVGFLYFRFLILEFFFIACGK